MNKLILTTLAAVTLVGSGCVYEERVVVDHPHRHAVVREQYVATLPVGYRTRRWHGEDYYYHNDVYYRRHPRGYVVVARPW